MFYNSVSSLHCIQRQYQINQFVGGNLYLEIQCLVNTVCTWRGSYSSVTWRLDVSRTGCPQPKWMKGASPLGCCQKRLTKLNIKFLKTNELKMQYWISHFIDCYQNVKNHRSVLGSSTVIEKRHSLFHAYVV